MYSCKLNPETGAYTQSTNERVAAVTGEKIHIYISYIFNYDDGVYQVCIYAGGIDADGRETIENAKYTPNTASIHAKPFVNLTERTSWLSS